MQKLFEDHWDEVASHKEIRSLNIHLEAYKQLNDLNLLICIGAFEDDVIVGYSVNFLAVDLHDCTKVISQNDAIYVDPKYRKGSVGIKLIKAIEKESADRGATFVNWHAKVNTPLDHVLEKLGYGVKEIIYAKEV